MSINNKISTATGIVGMALLSAVSLSNDKSIARSFGLPESDQEDVDRTRKIGIFSGVAAYAFSATNRKINSEGFRSMFFMGAQMSAGVVADRKKGYDPITAVGIQGLTVLAGFASYKYAKSTQKDLFNKLRTLLVSKGKSEFVNSIDSTYETVLKKAPYLKNFLSEETIPRLLEVGVVPFAHSATLRATVGLRKADASTRTLIQNVVDNSAGEKTERKDSPGSYPENDPRQVHTGVRLRTHTIER